MGSLDLDLDLHLDLDLDLDLLLLGGKQARQASRQDSRGCG